VSRVCAREIATLGPRAALVVVLQELSEPWRCVALPVTRDDATMIMAANCATRVATPGCARCTCPRVLLHASGSAPVENLLGQRTGRRLGQVHTEGVHQVLAELHVEGFLGANVGLLARPTSGGAASAQLSDDPPSRGTNATGSSVSLRP
jgi:hypothetical protein